MKTGLGVDCDVKGCENGAIITEKRKTVSAHGSIGWVYVSYCGGCHMQVTAWRRRVSEAA